MKKVCLVFICVFISIFFCGCIPNRHSNSFVEGTYTAEDCKLIVTAIDEETFKNKNGVNVVEDDSVKRTNQYYEVVLSVFDADSESYIELTFYNLVQISVRQAPCYYNDENGNSIYPNSTIRNYFGYIIEYDGESYRVD